MPAAVAGAPAAAEEKVEEVVEEEEEEVDMDMGGMFGDDGDDYWALFKNKAELVEDYFVRRYQPLQICCKDLRVSWRALYWFDRCVNCSNLFAKSRLTAL